jgi:aminoglycoside/choline kinase family phosphotransferase
MPERDALIADFLDKSGWGAAARGPLAGDASFRRYDRLQDGSRRAVLMDAPPPQEDVRPFAMLARHLAALGFSAPEILAEDTEAGFLLLEDLGDDTYTRVLASGTDPGERALYALAVDVLIDLHRREAAEALPADLPAYDEQRLVDEALLLTDWYMPAVLGRDTTGDARDGYIEAWSTALKPVVEAPPRLVLCDYHVDNLIWLPGRDGTARCGLLDFQDAVAGHPAYDLMSLIEDARRDIDPGLHADMLARYRDAFPELAEDDDTWAAFRRDFAVLAAQRHAKVIGIFTRLWRRDAKPDYLVHIPRVWRLLERALADPALASVVGWFDTNLPPEHRKPPAAET